MATRSPANYGELLAVRLMRHAEHATSAACVDGWFEGCARQAATLIDAALHAATLANLDPRIIQMELANYFVNGRCELGDHGERYLDDASEVDIDGMTFIDQLSEAARLDGLARQRGQ